MNWFSSKEKSEESLLDTKKELVENLKFLNNIIDKKKEELASIKYEVNEEFQKREKLLTLKEIDNAIARGNERYEKITKETTDLKEELKSGTLQRFKELKTKLETEVEELRVQCQEYNSLIENFNEEKRNLEIDISKLTEEKKSLNQEITSLQELVAKNKFISQKIVTLNVGGQVYSLSARTLCHSRLFQAKLNGDWKEPLERDEMIMLDVPKLFFDWFLFLAEYRCLPETFNAALKGSFTRFLKKIGCDDDMSNVKKLPHKYFEIEKHLKHISHSLSNISNLKLKKSLDIYCGEDKKYQTYCKTNNKKHFFYETNKYTNKIARYNIGLSFVDPDT